MLDFGDEAIGPKVSQTPLRRQPEPEPEPEGGRRGGTHTTRPLIDHIASARQRQASPPSPTRAPVGTVPRRSIDQLAKERRLGTLAEELEGMLESCEAARRDGESAAAEAGNLLRSGQALAQEGQHDRAIKKFQQGLRLVEVPAGAEAGKLREDLQRVVSRNEDLQRATLEDLQRLARKHGLASGWKGTSEVERVCARKLRAAQEDAAFHRSALLTQRKEQLSALERAREAVRQRLTQGRELMVAYEFEQAIDVFDGALDLQLQDAELAQQLAQARTNAERASQQQRLLREQAEAHYINGQAAQRSREWSKAEDCYEHGLVLAKRPKTNSPSLTKQLTQALRMLRERRSPFHRPLGGGRRGAERIVQHARDKAGVYLAEARDKMDEQDAAGSAAALRLALAQLGGHATPAGRSRCLNAVGDVRTLREQSQVVEPQHGSAQEFQTSRDMHAPCWVSYSLPSAPQVHIPILHVCAYRHPACT
jgi:tetratricopeptide (TPR) repeat protein